MRHAERQDLIEPPSTRPARSTHGCAAPPPSSAPPCWCRTEGYLAQFEDKRPALRVFGYKWLELHQQGELELPAADIVIIDESAIGAMTEHMSIDPAHLTELETYAAPNGKEEQRQSCCADGGGPSPASPILGHSSW